MSELAYSALVPLVVLLVAASAANAQLSANRITGEVTSPSPVSDVNIDCSSTSIRVTIQTPGEFNGMIYPKGLSKNSSCMIEFSHTNNVTYELPLRSCNTMSTDVDDGVEYFNTVVVQPHRRLVTSQGRGYHIRCRYQTKERVITNGFNVSDLDAGVKDGNSMIGTTPVTATAPMPACTMKIYQGETDNEVVAENVKIGDKLTLSIAIDYQDVYGMRVTNCLVRDGLNWGEQPLINDEGCPVDEEIMGGFEYSGNLTRAHVTFHAHKFPYTSSVYYQCNVRLCLKEGGGCSDLPPECDRTVLGYRRRKRDVSGSRTTGGAHNAAIDEATLRREEARDLSIEVFSGLYVNEAEDEEGGLPGGLSPSDAGYSELAGIRHEMMRNSNEEFCISMRKFAVGVALASLLLMLAVILLVVCVLQRRRRKASGSKAALHPHGHGSLAASSIYSGPYSNRAFSRDGY